MSLDEQFKQRKANASLQFIRLRDVRFDSAIPNRAIDWKYVEQLQSAPAQTSFPALDVMWVPNGNYYELLDGQHRWWSIVFNLINNRPNAFPPPDDDGPDGFARHLRNCVARMDDTIQARIWPELSAWEVRLIRFWKNRDHGLGSSATDRKEMARAMKQQNPLLTLEQIAREVRCSPSFVSKALNETELREEKTPDGFRDTKKFCDIVERLYGNGFFQRAQVETREEWLRDDTGFCKAYEGIARQMLKEVERARK